MSYDTRRGWPFVFVGDGWGAVLWGLFSKYRWYRRWRGGVWQKFQHPGLSINPPYFTWHEMRQVMEDAVETEDHRKQTRKESGE